MLLSLACVINRTSIGCVWRRGGDDKLAVAAISQTWRLVVARTLQPEGQTSSINAGRTTGRVLVYLAEGRTVLADGAAATTAIRQAATQPQLLLVILPLGRPQRREEEEEEEKRRRRERRRREREEERRGEREKGRERERERGGGLYMPVLSLSALCLLGHGQKTWRAWITRGAVDGPLRRQAWDMRRRPPSGRG